MIEEKTLFILGAGASKPYEYPTGEELRSYIIKDFVVHFKRYLKDVDKFTDRRKKEDADKALKFSKMFKDSSIRSIDKFLAFRPEFSNIGKIAIATCILECERRSFLNEDVRNKNEDWYSLLFNRMIESFSSPEDYKRFGENKISFITFNYDRSLEYIIQRSIKNSFRGVRIDDQNDLSFIKTIIPFKFIHIYGQIDKPNWLGGEEYRREVYYERIIKCASNIKVIGERSNEQNEEIKELFNIAKRVFFLGFGYATENLEALGEIELSNIKKQIFGTALHYSRNQIKRVREILENIYRPHLVESPMISGSLDCCGILKEYL